MRTTNRPSRAALPPAWPPCSPPRSARARPRTRTPPATTPTRRPPALDHAPRDIDCTPEAMPTLEDNILTIATDQPAYEPWMVDDDPTNGEGFEAAVAYAVAEQLGYAEDAVTWTRVPFNAAIQPGPKAFDFDINQFTITKERAKAVDFSSPYYTAVQAVVTTGTSPAADGDQPRRPQAAADRCAGGDHQPGRGRTR